MAPATATLTPSPAVVPTASPTAALTLENVLYEKRGGIAYVTVNRPKVLNALNTPTWKDLRTAFEDARDDPAVRGVILTGAGDKAFIAGADISELAPVGAVEAEQSSRFGQEVLDLIEKLGKPVIAAVNGFALGGGCETAMACTIRLAAETAKFGQPEVKLGLLPGGGGTQRLPRLVGKGRALQLILTGEMIDAQEAYRIGLVNEIVPAGGSDPARGGDPEEDRRQRSDRRRVRARGDEQGAGDQPERRLAAGGRLLRPLRSDRGQEGGHDRLPREARASVPRPVKQTRLLTTIRTSTMASDNIFSGLKVVDLASFIAGPSAAVILSDFGADVIKVEPPTGDLWRHGHQDPAAAAGRGSLSLAPRQSQQARHDPRSEISERTAGSRAARQVGRRSHRQHAASRARAIEARV